MPLHFEIAGLGARLAAQLIDILITVGLALAIVVLLLLVRLSAGAGLFAVAALLFFLVRVPYYVATELLWNGQTVGKRICALRVISGNGRSLAVHQVVARNLMKEMEVFLPGNISPHRSRSRRGRGRAGPRLDRGADRGTGLRQTRPAGRRHRRGDPRHPSAAPKLLEPDLAAAATAAAGQRFVFLPHQLEHYGAYELQVLEKFLQGGERLRNAPPTTRTTSTSPSSPTASAPRSAMASA